MRAKKHLGQHFLTSEKALRQMIEAGNVKQGDTVLEIGPGKGALTRHLLAQGAHVVAVEMDPDMIAFLSTQYAEEMRSGALTLIEGDILNEETLQTIAPLLVSSPRASFTLIANIPYYITGEIIRTFLSGTLQPLTMTLLVQKEVAERIARDQKESVLSLSVKAYGAPTYVATVPKGAFTPAPSVDSAILHIAHISRSLFEKNMLAERDFFHVVKTGLGSRRKMLRGLLVKKWGEHAVDTAFAHTHIPHTARGEDVHVTTWMQLSALLTASHK